MPIFEPIFKSLNEAGVRYVIVDGLAVVLHGHVRLTADVDLVVDLDDESSGRVIDALVALNFRPQVPVDPKDFADKAIRERWIRDHNMEVFSMVDPSNPMRAVDLFVDHPMPFEELWSRSVEFTLSGTTVRVASIPDLIQMKRKAGRPQDRSDIEELEAIQRERERYGKS
jgi:predicted nucleotidyltransferase